MATKKASKKASKKKATSKKATSKKKASKKKSSGKKPGLYANIQKAQARQKKGGKKVRKKGEAGAPTDKAFKKAKRTAKK